MLGSLVKACIDLKIYSVSQKFELSSIIQLIQNRVRNLHIHTLCCFLLICAPDVMHPPGHLSIRLSSIYIEVEVDVEYTCTCSVSLFETIQDNT